METIDEIDNPLLLNQCYDPNIKISRINTFYILIKTSKNKFNNSIYKSKINKELYENYSKQLMLYKITNNIKKIISNKNKLLVLPKESIIQYNIFNYSLEETNYIIPIFDIEFENIMIYLKQFDNNNLDEIFKLLVLNNYFNNNNNLKNKILNLDVINKDLNILISIDAFFDKRNTNIKMNINKNINYMNFKFNSQYNNPFKNKHINFINDNSYSKNEINNLFDLLKDNKEELYYLFFKLLNSQYYHLILKNTYILKNYKHVIDYHLLCITLKHIWNIEYVIETNKNINYTKEDAFTIDEASYLPVYPVIKNNPRINPYMLLFIDYMILQPAINVLVLENYKTNNLEAKKYHPYVFNGICNLEEFKYRLNIFITKNPNNDIFKNINFKKLNIAITGSIMTACLQRYHPLMSLFNHFPEEEQFSRYFDEYYALSDIDIMFYAENTFEYIKNIYHFYQILQENICDIYKPYAKKEHVKINFEKELFFFITKEDIEKYIIKNNNLLDINYIIKNLNTEDNLKLFEPFVLSLLEEYKKDIYIKYSDYINIIPEYFNFDNLIYQVRLTYNKIINNEIINTDMNIKINYKYKINCVHLNHTFELFQVNKGSDFFATVHSFHLPCVRAYYDRDNVYLTPSCITAHLTGMNIDFKYTASVKEPMDIINKYRQRGFGTYLNNKEKKQYTHKTITNNYWKTLLENNTLLSSLYFSSKIFQPRMYLPDCYNHVSPVDLEKGYHQIEIPNNNIILNINDFIIEINNRYKNKSNDYFLNYIYSLNVNYILYNPIPSYIIEAFYNE
jgi:hypothetical protein